MSIETELQNVVAAASALNQTVRGQIDQINATVGGAIANNDARTTSAINGMNSSFESWKSNARYEWPFVNLLKNAHMLKQDVQGNFIDLPFVLGAGVEAFSVVTPGTPELPQPVMDWFNAGLIMGHGHLLRIDFVATAEPRYWLAANSVVGQFSGGFKFVYVHTGRVRGIQAGQVGAMLDVYGYRTWHIDFVFGDVEPGTVAYFGMPFVVAGALTDVNQVRTINYPDSKLNFI